MSETDELTEIPARLAAFMHSHNKIGTDIRKDSSFKALTNTIVVSVYFVNQ
jgi:hypothetical protein